MENTFVVKDEPITIRITIEVIPSKKKEEVAKYFEEPKVIASPMYNLPKDTIVTPPIVKDEVNEIVVVPVAIPEKKKRAYTKKTKEVAVPVEEEKKDEPVEEEKPIGAVPSKSKTVKSTIPANKLVARLAQMIRFYCKASDISTTEVTKKYLIDHGAADIIEGATEEDIEEAFKEVVKK